MKQVGPPYEREAMIGQRYGRLTVIGMDSDTAHQKIICKCDCGNQSSVYVSNIKRGHTRSCGCLHKERLVATATKHGDIKHHRPTPEYTSWALMKARCFDPKNKSWSNYGGRGITVCKEWADNYKTFLHDMGRKPEPGYTLDRINTNGNYEPSNCRWSTWRVQQQNRRNNHNITMNGETHCLLEWSRIIGISESGLRRRLRIGCFAK